MSVLSCQTSSCIRQMLHCPVHAKCLGASASLRSTHLVSASSACGAAFAPRPKPLASLPEPSCSSTHLPSSTSSYTAPTEVSVPALHCIDARSLGALLLASHGALSLLAPASAHAESLSLSGSALETLREFVEHVDSLGTPGMLLVILAIVLTEMVPLFPTQPLALASGMLYGPVQGAAVVLVAVSLAASNAFFLSRGIGKSLAQKVIAFEMAPEHAKVGEEAVVTHNAVSQKLIEMRTAVETGSFWDQMTAVFLLRLTPIVPFSASNYVIGLTSIPFPPFAMGTVAGMSVWSLLYASIGGAGRLLLEDGSSDMGTVFGDMLTQASGYSANIGKVGLAAASLATAVHFATRSPREEEPVNDEPSTTTSNASSSSSGTRGTSSSGSSGSSSSSAVNGTGMAAVSSLGVPLNGRRALSSNSNGNHVGEGNGDGVPEDSHTTAVRGVSVHGDSAGASNSSGSGSSRRRR